MRCSIVVCTRNGELFLGEQLASFLRQERLPDEIVICDDASSDASRSIIDSFVGRALERGINCRVFLHEVAFGVTENFEFGCNQATGDVIFLSDQDDRWHEDKIARMLPAFADPRVILVNSDARLVDGEGQALGETLFDRLRIDDRERQSMALGDLSRVGAYKNLFTGATMAFRGELRDFASPFSRQVHHDDWLAQMAWLSGSEIRTVSEPLMDYRLHAANTIGLGKPIDRLSNLSSSDRLARYLDNQATRLNPVVERANSLAAEGIASAMRLRIRERQLELVRRRRGYSTNPIIRFGQVLGAVSDGLYAAAFDPWRTAFLDLFRVVKRQQTT